MRSEEDRIYLANKHKGGEANAKGGLYEDYYTIYQIVSCIAKYKESMGDIAFQTQLEDTFVDDLLIAYPNINVYHQLKNTQKLNWNTKSSNRTIKSDFENQIRDCKERNEQFALKLVFSADKSRVGGSIPVNIKKYTTTDYFPFEKDLNVLVLICGAFQDVLRQILVNGNSVTVDELVNVAIVLLGVWRGCGYENKVRLVDILNRATTIKHFNLTVFPDGAISQECRVILDKIEGLDYFVRGRMFYWQLDDFTGSCPWPECKEQEIIDKKPTTRRELIVIL